MASSASNETGLEPTRPWSLAADGWADFASAKVYPGQMVLSYHGGCTTNFVFTNTNGTRVFVGTAAHCAATKQDADTSQLEVDPCALIDPPETEPERRQVFFGNNLTWNDPAVADAVGHYVYNSWWQMYGNETDTAACAWNDFALIEVNPQYLWFVNPSLESWGGPTGLHGHLDPTGDNAQIYTVGGTWMRDTSETAVGTPFNPLYFTRPRTGVAMPVYDLQFAGKEWSFNGYFDAGCIPGDSGSPVLFEDGTAIGVVIAVTGKAARCSISYLDVMVQYAIDKTGLDLVLHTGTQQFTGGIYPI